MNWILTVALSLSPLSDALPPQPEEVLRLPDSLVQEIDEHVIERSDLADIRLDHLVSYMFSDDGLNFSYIVGPTRNAAATYAAGRGNCLSFTLLFLALAEQAGIHAEAREVPVPLNWRRDGSALFESGHVNVFVRTEARRAIVDFEPDPIRARQQSLARNGKRISRDRVLAHFYNNRAAELLSNGKPGLARLWSDHALALDANFTAVLNNRGVIEARLGEYDRALEYYERVLSIDADNRSALFNTLELFRRTGQHQQARSILDQIEGLRSRDPYLLWSLARNLERLGEHEHAKRLYRRAIGMKDDEALFHAGMARSARELGETELARRALSRAIALGRAQPDQGFRLDQTLLALKSELFND